MIVVLFTSHGKIYFGNNVSLPIKIFATRCLDIQYYKSLIIDFVISNLKFYNFSFLIDGKSITIIYTIKIADSRLGVSKV